MSNCYQLINRIPGAFFERVLKTKVYFEYHDHENIQKVRAEVIKCVRRLLNVISVSKEGECDVKVVFCPIVSRAGTDIEAALSRLELDKPTIVIILHHTFDPDYNAPGSSRYERNNLILVDLLFHEDKGLLDCSKNDEAFSKTERYLKKYAKPQRVVHINRLLAMIAIVVMMIRYKRLLRKIMCKLLTRLRSLCIQDSHPLLLKQEQKRRISISFK